MALANDGIMHKAICPAWTDTAIVSTANSNDKISKSQIKARLGHFKTLKHQLGLAEKVILWFGFRQMDIMVPELLLINTIKFVSFKCS